jgi:hypothetical protein
MIIDYILEGERQWDVEIPEEITNEILAIVNKETGEIEAMMDENFFSPLYFYVLEVLEGYYKDF